MCVSYVCGSYCEFRVIYGYVVVIVCVVRFYKIRKTWDSVC